MPRDERLDDHEYVIRFGIMALDHTRKAMEDAKADPEVDAYELSFFGDKGLTRAEIGSVAEAPNPRMRVSTVREMREAGFEPFLDEPPPAHIGLRFDVAPSEDQIAKLIELFDEPEENPHPFR